MTADVGRLAQRRPGDSVRFRPVELSEARRAVREQQALLDRLERGA
jgi:allophanate hydrolase subunit 2